MTKAPNETQPPKSSKQVKAEAREKRLKEQLRQNLHRRKAQGRVRKADQQDSE